MKRWAFAWREVRGVIRAGWQRDLERVAESRWWWRPFEALLSAAAFVVVCVVLGPFLLCLSAATYAGTTETPR